MPIKNRINAFASEMTTWRRHLHQNPELGFECHQTACFVVERLRAFGITEIHQGIAQSGVVALIDGQQSGPTVGLRADMDALAINEATGAPWASRTAGRMHACGHDGHTSMLLGAAKYLAESRAFAGRVALIFQPAEEAGGGGNIMVQEGILDRFDIAQVYALHNAPGLPVGSFHSSPGPIMAAVDTFHIDITGLGGHGAMPEITRDPVITAAGLVQALQTIASRNAPARQALVISVTQIHAGSADNIIPETAQITGTVRTFDPDLRDLVDARMGQICAGYGAAHQVDIALDYQRWYPATVNDPDRAAFASDIARGVVGAPQVDAAARPLMVAEDFAYFLETRPGAYLLLGQGNSAGLHHPAYDFNDAIAPIGASYFATLIEAALPLS